MTLEEKAAFLTGKNEWCSRGYKHLGIESITFADGPSGVRRQYGNGDHLGLNPSTPATCFPSSSTLANSWDEALEEKVGSALGQEAALEDVAVLLAPGLNLKRNPLCGRNFEYFSEDPYLSVRENGGSYDKRNPEGRSQRLRKAFCSKQPGNKADGSKCYAG